MELYTGVVENRQDPLKLGRCQVRVVGLHTHDKNQIPTSDLPWAYPMQPVTSAAMSGIGTSPVGPVEGTWVVIMFRDDDNQMPIMLGTVGGIPQTFGAIDQDPDGAILKDETGTSDAPTTAESVVSTNTGKAISLTPQQQAQNILAPGTNPTTTAATITTDIPTDPPPEFKTLRDQRKKSIQALLAACDKSGITSREARCSILAMAGGESGFIPEDEGYSYGAAGLKSTFYTTFVKKNPDKVTEYERAPKKGMSRETFFDFVYAPENNGSQLGNTQTGDGGKYFGRGFTGITGRANYKKYGDMIGVDLLSNPNILNTDLSVSAQASVAMINDNTNKKFPKVSNTANPEYFYAVKKAQGNDTGDGAEKRLRYYEYFYGTKTASTFTEEKSAAPLPPSSTDTTVSTQPSPSTNGAGPVGFRDPNNKYPLKKFFNEPDTNRLARGIKTGTIHTLKDGTRVSNVPIALVDDTFSEPTSTFAAKYPYNHVMETESGHVQEFDDTPGHERIMTYHRKGTYTEVDPNGTQVNHIVGDGYQIMDRNGSIFIKGDCNLTVEGKINILSKAIVNIEVYNDANIKVGNDATIGVAHDVDLAVGNDMKVEVAQTLSFHANAINMEAATTFNIKAATLNETASAMNVNASNYNETVGTSNYRWNGTKYIFTGADTHERHNSGTDYSNSSDPSRSSSDGAAAAASAASAAAVVTGLTPPAQGVNVYDHMDFLETPPSEGEDVFLIETEEEWASPAGIAKQAELVKQNGPAPSDIQDSTTPSGGVPVSLNAGCSVISTTENFTNDFRLSPNFTLGMLIDGGVNGANQLRDQNGLTKQQIVCNLAQLCLNIYEPMLAVLPGGIGGYGKQWKINSGYRISSNVPAGGVAKSDHMLGRATDFTLLPYGPTKAQRNFEFASTIEKILPYDQIIMEYMSGGSNWIHVGYRGTKDGDTAGGGLNRKMAFTMSNGSTVRKDGKTGFFLLQ